MPTSRDVTNRVANLGYVALARDLFTREGGPPPMDDLEAMMARLFAMSDETVLGDLEGAADLLRTREDCDGKVGCIGFCMGGRYTLLLACASNRLDAAVDCWGGFIDSATLEDRSTPERPTPPLELADRLSCPLMAAIGAEDHNPSPEVGERLRERAARERPAGHGRRLRGRRARVLRRLPSLLPARAGGAPVGADRPVPRPPPQGRLTAVCRSVGASRHGSAQPHSYSAGRGLAGKRARGAWLMERKWWTLIAVSVAIFMLLLDITVVNVALPDIQRSLHSSFSDLQWVVNAYALTLAAFLLTSGSVADLIGRKRVFVAGLIVFTTSSAVCGLSSTPLMLNLARAVQGTGGAMMFATALALLAEAFHGKERGTAFGVFGAVTGGAVAIGPGARRGDHLGHRLGVDLLRERSHRRRRGVPHALPRERLARPERHRRGLAGPRDLLRVAVPARLRARAGQRKGLGLDRRSSRF